MNSIAIEISGKKGAFYPLELHVSLTDICVQACKHCYKAANTTGTYIDMTSLMSFLNCMSGAVPYLTLSGGEPLLHPGFSQIMERYADKFDICVLSSGLSIKESLFETLRLAKRGVVVSVYSSSPSVHDEFVGKSGSFDSIMQSIKIALKMGIRVGVTTILRKDNFNDIVQLVALLNHLGVQSVTVGRICSIGRAKENDIVDDVVISEELLKEIQSLLASYNNVVFLGIDTPSGNGYTSNRDVWQSPFHCTAGTLFWSIYEDGQIQPCGICSVADLSMGRIDNLDLPILTDRRSYCDRISKLQYIRELGPDCPCPFQRLSTRKGWE